MFGIRHFSEYVTDGTEVYSKNRMFPVTPRIHPAKRYKQYWIRQDNGDVKFVSQRMIDTLTIKSRGKSVTHLPTGKTFGSMKEACAIHKISVAQLKTNKDFSIGS